MNPYKCGANAALKAFRLSEEKPDWRYFDVVIAATPVANTLHDQILEFMEAEFIRGFNETLDELKADYPE